MCKYLKNIASLKLGIIFIIFLIFFAPNVFAKTSIVITYDISGSMIAPPKKSGQNEYYLTAGECKALAESVLHIIFKGNPINNPEFSSRRGGSFFSNMEIQSDKVKWPLWQDNMPIIYYEYHQNFAKKYDSTHYDSPHAENLKNELMKVLPYPKNLDPSDKNRSINRIRKAFKTAFPGEASLQGYRKLAAYKVYDEMIEAKDDNPKVILISVSDEDVHIGDSKEFDSANDQIRKDLFEFGDKYENSKFEDLYMVEVANHVLIRIMELTHIKKPPPEIVTEIIEVPVEKKVPSKREKIIGLELIFGSKTFNEEAYIDKKLQLKQKDEDTFVVKNDLHLKGLIGTIKKDYSIKDIIFKLLDQKREVISDQSIFKLSQINTNLPERLSDIKDPLPIKIHSSEEIIVKSQKAVLQVDYTYKPSNSKMIHNTASWTFNTIKIETNFIKKFFWIIPLLIFAAILILGIYTLWPSERQDPPDGSGGGEEPIGGIGGFLPGDGSTTFDNKDEQWDDFEEKTAIATPVIDEMTGASPKASIMLTCDYKGTADTRILNKDEVLYLSDEGGSDNELIDGFFSDKTWNLECPGHRLEFKNGKLHHNDEEVESNRLPLKNRHGEDVNIFIK